MMHLNNSIRYKRSFVNINPQSNTDFTQVTCTVHFYYNFSISRPNELLYQIQPEHYLIYSAEHQPQVYQCTGNNWSGLTITAGISILFFSDECNLNLTEHQINTQAHYQSTPVIEILPISSVYNRTRKYYTKTQTIIELVACSILLFLSFIAAIRAICNRVNRPRLLQLPL